MAHQPEVSASKLPFADEFGGRRRNRERQRRRQWPAQNHTLHHPLPESRQAASARLRQSNRLTSSNFVTSTRPEIGDAQLRDDRRGEEHVLHLGVVERAAAGAPSPRPASRTCARRSRRARPTSARRSAARPAPAPCRLLTTTKPPPTSCRRLAASAMSSLLVPTTIMWWLSWATVRGHGAVDAVAEARDEGVDHLARCLDGVRPTATLADVLRAVHGDEAVLDGQHRFQRPRRRLVLDDADDFAVTRVACRRARRCRNRRAMVARAELARCPWRKPDRRRARCRAIRTPFSASTSPWAKHDLDRRSVTRSEVMIEVGAAARGDRAELALEAEMRGGVERRHLDGGDGFQRRGAMAWRTMWSIWPSLTSVAAKRSSVQRMKLRGSRPCLR